jgi:hypothetical protein
MSDSGQGDGQRSWWEKPDQEPAARDPYGPPPGQSATDAHDPYRATPAPPTEGLPQYGRQPPAYPGQQYGQQSGQQYGQPQNQQYPDQYGGYGYPQQVPVAGMAHAVLWTAVGGLVLMFTGLGWIAAIVALALTPGARREIMEANGAKRGLGFLLAGKICAWVNIGLTVLGLIGLAILVGLAREGGFDGTSSFDSNSVSVLFTP